MLGCLSKNTLNIEVFLNYEESNQGNEMDKKIKKIEKESNKVGKDLKKLEKADKKRDKKCEMGEKMMKNKK